MRRLLNRYNIYQGFESPSTRSIIFLGSLMVKQFAHDKLIIGQVQSGVFIK